MAHEQDDFGYPLNPQCCPTCLARSQYMNEKYALDILTGHDPEVSYRKPSHHKELPE